MCSSKVKRRGKRGGENERERREKKTREGKVRRQ